MVKVDRQTLLDTLEQRHDALIDQLDALNDQIDAALVASGAAPAEAPRSDKNFAPAHSRPK